MRYYLMIKEAKGLGIKYLCKCGDYKDPIEYKGSGKLWRRIINKHNAEIETTILGLYDTNEELKKWGIHYSKLFNVVSDKSWANLKPEEGDGGITHKGSIRAYNPNTLKIKHFSSIEEVPLGWIRGAPRWKKKAASVERTRQAHIGKKRSDETRNNMINSTRRKRITVECTNCSKHFTKQNINRHMKGCNNDNRI